MQVLIKVKSQGGEEEIKKKKWTVSSPIHLSHPISSMSPILPFSSHFSLLLFLSSLIILLLP
jgi:hypothetical protein